MAMIFRAAVVAFAVFTGSAFVAFKGGVFTELAADEPKAMPSSKSYSGFTTVTSSGFLEKTVVPQENAVLDWSRITPKVPVTMSSSKSDTAFGFRDILKLGPAPPPIRPWEWNRFQTISGTATSWQP